jgi:hypothetical protein
VNDQPKANPIEAARDRLMQGKTSIEQRSLASEAIWRMGGRPPLNFSDDMLRAVTTTLLTEGGAKAAHERNKSLPIKAIQSAAVRFAAHLLENS